MDNTIGIDVGGTFTDVILIRGEEVIKKGKITTRQEDLLTTILQALDFVEISDTPSIGHITVSTTLVTNAIIQKRLHPVELVLFPGSGMRISALNWPVPCRILSGELDFRGREVQPANKKEWEVLADDLRKGAATSIAISGKFSHRNNVLEENLAAFLKQEIPELKIALGSEWGQSNFYRRSLTAYLNSACTEIFSSFSAQLRKAVRARGCNAPIRVLKADGGVLPLEKIRPVESIYSGPAASVLGALAQNDGCESYVVVDIGGTTTDIGLVLSGNPLMSSSGARVGSFLTNVRSLAVRSIPVGGDSAVFMENGEACLASHRLGPAYCIGGSHATPTDAMRFLNLTDYGSFSKAEEGLALLLPENERNPEAIQQVALTVVRKMADQIGLAIEQLLMEWKAEPAYKVWEVLHHHPDFRFTIRLNGGGAPGIATVLEQRMNTETIVTDSSEVSNAIGAALAKTTFSWTLNLDTSLSRYRIEETGEQGEWEGPKKPHKEVEQFLRDLALRQAQEMGIETKTLQTDPFDYFPLVENYNTVGQIVRGAMHVPPGVIRRVSRGEKDE
ncbi:MAG: Acetophenone carboxylase alpha subunit [Candidatus Dichloromethanomonas elyunquensis]|nr:MAG: Acetophenone carboxylase alpha subunit [Candidatus Dichloromethanomonas elyunquensis]